MDGSSRDARAGSARRNVSVVTGAGIICSDAAVYDAVPINNELMMRSMIWYRDRAIDITSPQNLDEVECCNVPRIILECVVDLHVLCDKEDFCVNSI